MAGATNTKRVTWAVPLIQPPTTQVSDHAGLHHPPTPILRDCDIQKPSKKRRSVVDSLLDKIRRAPPTVPSEEPDDRRDNAVIDTDHIFAPPQQRDGTTSEEDQPRLRDFHRSAKERANYEHSRWERLERERLTLQPDEYFYDSSEFFLWAAPCKFVDVLEARETELTSDYYFSSGDVLVSLFINNDLTLLNDDEYLARALALPLIKFFCNARSFRFAVFFPRQHVEKKLPLPNYLRYVFGTLKELGRSPNLHGAQTEMETKFLTKELRSMRRRSRIDHVQIHKDSLEKDVLIAKVDEKDLNEEPMEGGRLLGDVQEVKATARIAIPRSKKEDVDAAWVVNKKGGVWA